MSNRSAAQSTQENDHRSKLSAKRRKSIFSPLSEGEFCRAKSCWDNNYFLSFLAQKNDAIGKILFIYLALDHQGWNGANQHFKPKFSTDAEKYGLDSEQEGS
ncbi:hypothetical protein [Shewanella chilikensis]|uniref:hypothetical protein n=1 Tax=Shewanella chilikensis TaxID=558541 RepID=UPI001F41BB96|nr:hypothetical protein [Shewanella chilikensis]MCE9786543.1 hypothetical protein [Shewanella chilikensis]